jgi:predicted dehydrogenase
MQVAFAQYGISHGHASGKAQVLTASPDVNFRGVYEPDPEARRTRGSGEAYCGLHWFESKEEMLGDESISAIAVEGKVSENLEVAREAIEHGKHVWLDKPAGTDWDAFQELVGMAREKGLLIQLGYMFRYHAGFRFILEWAREGRLGQVFSVRGRMSTFQNEAGREYLSVYEGGTLFELLPHLIDFLVTLLGRPDRITSFLRNDLGTVPAYRDNTAAVFEYPRAMAILESSALEVSAFPSRRMEVYGTRGAVIMEPLEPDPILRLCLDEDRDGYAKGWQTVPIEIQPRYVGSLAALVADIRGEKEPDRSLDHELTVQETALRAAGILQD